MNFEECRNCMHRHRLCHAECKDYLRNKEKNEEMKRKRRLDDLSGQLGSHSWRFMKTKNK